MHVDRGKQIGLGSGQRMRRIGGNFVAKLFKRRNNKLVVGDHAANRLAPTQSFGRADQGRKIEPASGLIPAAERAICGIVADRFARTGPGRRTPSRE